VLPDKGVNNSSGTSQPGNFYSDNGITGNPYYASGCVGKGLIANSANGTCRTNTVAYIQDIPKTQQESLLGKATFKLSEDNIATVEYLHSRSTNSSAIAPSPLTGITMTSASPYYPGGSASVPAVAGLTGEDLTINWRTVAAGKRQGYDTSISDRLVLASEGLVAGWDYNVGLTYAINKASQRVRWRLHQRLADQGRRAERHPESIRRAIGRGPGLHRCGPAARRIPGRQDDQHRHRRQDQPRDLPAAGRRRRLRHRLRIPSRQSHL
jgi:hypothetical protein